MEDDRMKERQKEFMKKTPPDLSQQRLDYASKLRKSQKDARIHKKRIQLLKPDSLPENGADYEKFIATFHPLLGLPSVSIDEKVRLVASVFNAPIYDPKLLQNLLIFLRKAAAAAEDPPTELLVKLGFLSKLSMLLDVDNTSIRKEAAWILTNIAANSENNHVNEMIELNIHAKLVSLLSYPDDDLKEQCLWALGNIAFDSVSARNEVVKTGVTLELAKMLSVKQIRLQMLQLATWVLSALSQGKPELPLEMAKGVIERLQVLLYLSNKDVVKEVLWIYAHLLEVEGKTANYTMKQIQISRIINFVDGEDLLLKVAAVRVVGNICAWEDKRVESVIEHGGVTVLKRIIVKGEDDLLVREACWALSNIAVGPSRHVQMLIDQGIISKLSDIVRTSTNYPIKREAGWTILNACRCKSVSILNQLTENGALHAVNELLSVKDTSITLLALEVLKGILTTGTEGRKFFNLLESLGFVQKLEELQLTSNIALYKRVEELLEHFVYSDQDEIMVTGNDTEYS